MTRGEVIAVLQDLGGPKLRLGTIPGDAVDCRLGEKFSVMKTRTSDDPRQLTCAPTRTSSTICAEGDDVLFADGTVIMRVEGPVEDPTKRDSVVTLGGKLRSKQGNQSAECRPESSTP